MDRYFVKYAFSFPDIFYLIQKHKISKTNLSLF